MSNFPLYQGSIAAACEIQPGQSAPINTGLWFTKFYSGFNEKWEVDETDKRGWIDATARQGPSGNADQIKHLLERQRKLCDALGGKTTTMQTQGNFVTGTGLSHPVENGFTFHPTLGMPYLPSSGVKGLLRGWVEIWMDMPDSERHARMTRWFGKANGGDDSTNNDSEEGAGCFIFFDALPSKPVNLGCDVMTPHMGKWYEKGSGYTARDEATTAPADWHSPNPIPFMVVKAATDFNFMIAPRTSGKTQADAQTLADLPTAMQALKDALEWLGAGAKTAAGYGRMQENLAARKEHEEQLKKIAQQAKERVEQEARAALLTQMSPLDRFIAQAMEERTDKNLSELPMLMGLVKQSKVPDGLRAALIQRLRDLMVDSKKWKEKSEKKNPEKDGDYQDTLRVQAWLKSS